MFYQTTEQSPSDHPEARTILNIHQNNISAAITRSPRASHVHFDLPPSNSQSMMEESKRSVVQLNNGSVVQQSEINQTINNGSRISNVSKREEIVTVNQPIQSVHNSNLIISSMNENPQRSRISNLGSHRNSGMVEDPTNVINQSIVRSVSPQLTGSQMNQEVMKRSIAQGADHLLNSHGSRLEESQVISISVPNQMIGSRSNVSHSGVNIVSPRGSNIQSNAII